MTYRAGVHENQVAQETKTTKVDTVLDTAVNNFNSSWEYTQSNYHHKWDDAFSLYNNRRVKKGYQGITDTFVPMTFSTIETMVAALFGSKPKFDYEPPQDHPDQNTEILNSLLDYYWDKDKWNIKVIKWGRGMLREGTSIIYLYWNVDHPCIINVPIRDFFIDPTATSLETARFMGRRYLTTIEELKGFEIVDPETGDMKPRYKDLDKVQVGTTSDSQTDKEKKDMFYGSTVTDPESKQVEVLEYWNEDRVVSVANRSVVIEDTENWFKAKDRENQKSKGKNEEEIYPSGIKPFACFRNYTDESLFYGKGEVEVIADEQELLNDLTNQNQDSIIYALNQMYTLDPRFAHLLNEIENIPGAVYLAEAGALQPIQQRPIPPDAFNERLNLKNEIRETTASNEVVKGVGNEGAKSTATEVNAQIAGAGQRLSLKVTQIENEGFHQLAKIVFEMVKRYVTEPMMVKIVGKDGIRWEEFDPSEFQGDYEPRVQLDTTIQSQKAEDAAMAKEMLAGFLNDPDVNQPELKKMVLRKAFDLDPDEVELLIQPVDPMAGEMGMEGMPPEMPPEMMELPPEMTDMMGELPPEMMEEMPPEPMTEVIEDPVTGELIEVPIEDAMPTEEELAMIEAGL
jgi:hypothetical protein